MKMNISKWCLCIYCLIAAFFWEAVYDAIYWLSVRLLKLCKFVEQRIAHLHDVVDENF